MDDIVLGSMSQHLVEQFVRHMSTEFEMSLVRELTYFLGLQLWQTNSRIFISQAKYVKNLVNKFKFDTTKHRRTLTGTHDKITKDEARNNVDLTLYKSMIGSLSYLTASRTNLCYSVGVCVRH